MVEKIAGGERGRGPSVWTLRDAIGSDVDFVRTLSETVFSIYGNYGVLLPRWMRFPEVSTIVADGSRPVGFAMFAPIPFSAEEDSYFADLLAIAVHPAHHRRGVGRTLLEEVIRRVEATAEDNRVTAIRLTVADTNLAASHLFARFGFAFLPAEEGRYDGGQRALRMERLIRPAP